ncbi:multifunctional methyltransferase subunit TRM112, partial [Tremellales sp. Uapishka_1]
MVRLITHNMLTCHVKNCTKDNFPLVFSDVELVIREAPENPDFLIRFLPKLDWTALVDTARSLGDTSLPESQPETLSPAQITALHHVLMEIHVEEGAMNCRGCGHVYPISNGIPNMVRVASSSLLLRKACGGLMRVAQLLAEHEVGR